MTSMFLLENNTERMRQKEREKWDKKREKDETKENSRLLARNEILFVSYISYVIN